MSNNHHSPRRGALKSLTLGIGTVASLKTIPATWTRPIVDGVILPAHAQLSEPFAIVACSAESQNGAPEGQAFQTGAEALINISATVSPIPPVGTLIRLIPTHDDPGQGSYLEQVEPTDASGVADGFISLGFPNADPFELGTVFTLRFEFDDTATFGDSFCEISFTVVADPG
jgi:hypothetical protein